MLNPMERREIRNMHEQGMSNKDIATVCDVSLSTIKRVLSGDYLHTENQLADRLEAFGLVTVDDGCYRTGILTEERKYDTEYVTPSAEIDMCTPEAELEAEQEIEARLKRDGYPT